MTVTKIPASLTHLSYPVDSKLYPDLCIARDGCMILMLRSFQFNALSRGNQRPNLPYKKTWRDAFRGIQDTSVATRNSATLLLEHRHFLNNKFLFTSIYLVPAVTSHLQLINQEVVTHHFELLWIWIAILKCTKALKDSL